MTEDSNSKTIDVKLGPKNNKYKSTIDYVYPSLNRKDLSDLSNINDKTRNFKKLNTNRDWSLNLYNLDIEGSSPRKFGFFFNKEDFTNKNNDIEKSTPKKYDQYINKISYNLINDDIEFSKPRCVKNNTTRHTNPLQPKYILSNPPMLPIPPPKFIRDNMIVSDIEGAKPKKIGNEKNLFKEPIKKDIIEFSWPKRPYVRKTKYDILDYKDVMNKKLHFRNTNPLRPIYDWKVNDNSKSIGPIEKNYPAVFSKYKYKNPFNLNNKDIEGTNTGSKVQILKFRGRNYAYSTKDILGAQSDTVKRGIITQRHLNPLSPQYKYLGHSEISNSENNPFNFGFKSTVFNNKRNSQKILFNINTNNSQDNNIFNSQSNNNDASQINENKSKINNNNNTNTENKILEKNIKIINDKEKDNQQYEPMKTDVKNNLKSFSTFNEDKVLLDKNKKKPETFFGLTHNEYLIPADINKNDNNTKNKFSKLKIPLRSLNDMKKRSRSTFSEDNNYCTQLDNFILSRNLKHIEIQGRKENNNSENNTASIYLANETKNTSN
jgi:hypothetical protein